MSWSEVAGLVGALLTVVALLLTFAVITPRRYRLGRVGINGEQPELERMVRDQGRLTMLAAAGAGLTVVALITEMAS